MRSLYETRQATLIAALRNAFGSFLEVTPDEAGLHVVAWLPQGMDDQALSQRIAEHDVEAPPLSFYAMEGLERGGFVLGYGSTDELTIHIGVDRMRAALADSLR
jgi:GntR family transcriptional regulator/MocR family aminotransferase